MNSKKIESLESYFKTENDHWNKYAFEMVCMVLKDGTFPDPETPIQLLDYAEGVFIELHESPIKAVQEFSDRLGKSNLTPEQHLFVLTWVIAYLKNTEFENIDLSPIVELLSIKGKALASQLKPDKPQSGNIRETLKGTIQKELEQLPETLKGLDPAQRLNVICKLIPYVLPKVESIDLSYEED